MISPRSRALLERYTLASRALSRSSGERLASEAGQSVEFHDFRPYGPGDELRYVDWKVYGRTGRLYTRLYQAERNIAVHILLDTSPSMALGNKLPYARVVAQLLSYAAQGSAAQIHLFGGQASQPFAGKRQVPAAWAYIDDAPEAAGEPSPSTAIKNFALRSRFEAGTGLALVISDLFDEEPLQKSLVALRARKLDASFLQLMSAGDLEPGEGRLEVVDAESGGRLTVGPDEVRAYRQAVAGFVERTRKTVLQAGFRYTLLKVGDEDQEVLERSAFAALIKAGILIRR